MTTVKTLREDMNTYVDDVVEPATAWRLFNSVLRDIAAAARIPTKQSFSILGTEKLLTLATDLIEIKEITVTPISGVKYDISAFQARYGMRNHDGRTIEWDKNLPSTATVVVSGYRLPQEITGDADIPEIPAQFHNLLSYGATVKYMIADEELPSVREWRGLYAPLLRDLYLFTESRRSTSSPVQSDPTPMWARG